MACALAATVGCGGCGPDGSFQNNSDGGTGGNGGAGQTGGGNAGSTGGTAGGTGGQGNIGGGGGQIDCNILPVTFRDFRGSNESGGHPDFESYSGVVTGLVQTMLDSDRKPVYAPAGSTKVTTGAAEFNQWYRTVPGVNSEVRSSIALGPSDAGAGYRIYDNSNFFLLDDAGYGITPGWTHNFHFTTEIHATFKYKGGEIFTFRGDDDVWVFVNNRLAVDLGGVHSALTGRIDFDAMASQLGLVVGQTYNFDVFHAERHTRASNFRMETSIECFIVIN